MQGHDEKSKSTTTTTPGGAAEASTSAATSTTAPTSTTTPDNATAMAATIEELAAKKWARTRSLCEPLTAFGVFVLFVFVGVGTDSGYLNMGFLPGVLALYISTVWLHVSRVREETYAAWSLRGTYTPQTFLQVLHQHPGLVRHDIVGLFNELWGFRLLAFLSVAANFSPFRGIFLIRLLADASLLIVSASAAVSVLCLVLRVMVHWRSTGLPAEVLRTQEALHHQRRMQLHQQQQQRMQLRLQLGMAAQAAAAKAASARGFAAAAGPAAPSFSAPAFPAAGNPPSYSQETFHAVH